MLRLEGGTEAALLIDSLRAATGMTSSVLGWPLTITRTPFSVLSTRKETFSETFALRPPSYSHAAPALWQASR
ncbi:MAG: hypothetical protein ACUVYA_14120 [Planctomycetota bacterium]